jgi:hypothetical protein
MNRRRALLVVFIAVALFLAYSELRGPSATESASGGGPGDGARDVTSSHPLPNETATPEPKSGCSTVPGR